jgi:hypothetical protein
VSRLRPFSNSRPRVSKFRHRIDANSPDQGTPVAIGDGLQDHLVRTAYAQGWSALTDGELLRVAEEAGFDLLLTTDTNLPHQQNLRGRRLAVAILSKNRWTLIKRRMNEIVAAVNSAKPGTYSMVDIPETQK